MSSMGFAHPLQSILVSLCGLLGGRPARTWENLKLEQRFGRLIFWRGKNEAGLS